MKFEHRETPCAWIAGVMEDGTEFSLSAMEDGRIRVSAPATSRDLWWIDLDASGAVTEYGRGFFVEPAAETVAKVAACGHEIAEAAKPLFADMEHPVYIRFGELPKGGRSTNHATGHIEPGVSCYGAKRRIGGGYFLAGFGLPAAAIFGAFGGYDKAYLVKGEIVGTGSDGEPCIANPEVIGELHYRNGYFSIDN